MKKFYTLLLFILLGTLGYGQTCPSSVTRTCTGGFAKTLRIDWNPGSCVGLLDPMIYQQDGGMPTNVDQFSCAPTTVIYRQAGFTSTTCNATLPFTLDIGAGVICEYNGMELPVTLSSFSSKTNKNSIDLLWRTEAEFENAGFEIQRSSNSRDWKTIAFVEGEGSTIEATDYTFLDKKPLKGVQYYRLNQVDYDGKSTFSKVISVAFETESNVSIYPNPAKDKLFVQVETTGTSTAIIFDNMGRKVLTTTLSGAGIDITTLNAGIYSVQVTNGNLIEKIRFIKE